MNEDTPLSNAAISLNLEKKSDEVRFLESEIKACQGKIYDLHKMIWLLVEEAGMKVTVNRSILPSSPQFIVIVNPECPDELTFKLV